jgi:hypothetical protein
MLSDKIICVSVELRDKFLVQFLNAMTRLLDVIVLHQAVIIILNQNVLNSEVV